MPSNRCQNLEPSFIFQHGWAFSDTCWQSWTKGLSSFLLSNRGYWGQPNPIDDGAASVPHFVIVCHSLGLHLLSPRLLAQASLLVIISGFAHFHGLNPVDGRFTRKHVQKMLSRITIDPVGLIHDFYRGCSCPDWPLDARTVNTPLLTQDLFLLDQNRIDKFSFAGLPPVLQLHGKDDKIVKPERAEELAEILGTSQLTIINGAGHGLPFTHPQACLTLIRDFTKKVC